MALTLKLDLSATAIDSALSDYAVRVSTVSIGSTANADVFTEDSGSGADVWFSSDQAGTSPIDAKLLYWSDVDSAFAFDVELASVSATVATTFYLQVGSKPVGYGTDPYDASTEAVWSLMSDFDDDTSNGNDGTGNGGITAGGVTGPDGVLPATDFDGSDDYVAAPNFRPTAAATVSMWANLDSVSGRRTFFSRWNFDGDNRVFLFEANGTNLRSFVSDDGNFNSGTGATGSSTLSTATWYHVAMVFDGSSTSLTLFLNGSQDGQNTSAGSSLFNPAGLDTTLGAETSTANPPETHFFDGIQSLAVAASTARSDAWINADYLLQGSGSATYWTVTDVTGGGGSNIPAIMYHRRRLASAA